MTFFNKARSVLRQNLCNKHVSIEGSASNLSIFQSIRHGSNRPSLKSSQKLSPGDVIDAGGMAGMAKETFYKAVAARGMAKETFYKAVADKVVKPREGNSRRSGFVTSITVKDFAIQDSVAEDLESKKVCIGSSLAEQNGMKRNLYHFKSLFLSKRRNENQKPPTRTRYSMVYNSSLYSNSIYCAAPSNQSNMKRKRQKKRIDLPTHYLEANYRTQKAVMFHGADIRHIPHNIKWKDMNMLTNERLPKK